MVNYANYRDGQNKKINRRPYWIYANYRDGQNKLELTGGHIGNYANYRDGQNRINRRPYWIYCIYIDYQNEIGFMIITKIKYW